MPKTTRDWVKVVFLFAILGLIALCYFERQVIGDYFKLLNYDPPAAIANLAQDDTMTAKAKHLFYINHPELEAKASFRSSCPNDREQTIILGCYTGNESGIHLLKVDDSRLDGVEQVTAAHEMLHAAYDRLSSSEKTKVNSWLRAYSKGLKDKSLIDIINSYKKSEPGSVLNEMHSVFGTQVADLPPKLNNYYKQYFTDRTKVVGYAKSYQSTFIDLKQKIASYDSRLSNLKQQISSDEAESSQLSSEIMRRRSEMNRLRSSGQTQAYNSMVDGYNASIKRYNQLVDQIKSEVASYNQLVVERNQNAIVVNNLGRELDANVRTVSPEQ